MATDLRRAALSEEEKRKEIKGKKCRGRECEREKRDGERGGENVEKTKRGIMRQTKRQWK